MAWSFASNYLGALTANPGLNVGSEWTIQCWIYHLSTPKAGEFHVLWSLYASDNDFDLCLINEFDQVEVWQVRGGSLVSNPIGGSIALNTWINIAVIRDSNEGQYELYYDGVEEALQAEGAGDADQGVFYIGSHAGGSIFDGRIDCFFVTDLRDGFVLRNQMAQRLPPFRPWFWYDPIPGSTEALTQNLGFEGTNLINIGSVGFGENVPIGIFEMAPNEEHRVSSRTVTLLPVVFWPGNDTEFDPPSRTLPKVGITSGPVSLTITPVVARVFAPAPAVQSGPVTLSILPVQARLVAADPAITAGGVSLSLDVVRATFVAVSPRVLSGGVTVFLTPGTMRGVVPPVGITVGVRLSVTPAAARFVVPAVAITNDVSVLISPVEGKLLAPAVGLSGAQSTEIALLPVVAQFVVPFPGQRSTVAITPLAARFVVPPIRIIGVVTLRDRIACVLVDEARAGEFYVVETNANTGKTSTLLSTKAETIETLTNETDANFDITRRHRRTFRDERRTWTWRLVLGFAQEVTIERFEEDLVRRPRVIPRDESLGFPQVTLRLRQTLYDHPVQQDANRGTRAILTFDAQLAPV